MVPTRRDRRPGARRVSPGFVRTPVRYWAEPGGLRIAHPASTRSRHQRTAAVGAPTGAKGPVAGARAAHAASATVLRRTAAGLCVLMGLLMLARSL